MDKPISKQEMKKMSDIENIEDRIFDISCFENKVGGFWCLPQETQDEKLALQEQLDDLLGL